MVWPNWNCERCAIVGCDKTRQVCSVIRKWADDKRNVGVIKWTKNQAHAPRPTHEQKHAHVIFEGMSTRRETNSCLCKRSTKKTLQLGIKLNH